MQIFSRVFGAAPKTSPVRRAGRSPRSRCSQIGVESLEGRNLTSAGITVSAGVLQITATQYANNTADVSTDQNGNVRATLNGNSQQFPAGSIWSICYNGGTGGGDTFRNNTSLTETAVGNGGNNHFYGGSSWNAVYLWGDHNSYDAQGGASEVLAYNGPNDRIPSYSNVSVYHYDFVPLW